MPATVGTPTLQEVLRLVMAARVANIHVALPGRVESYDSAKQTASIKPMVKRGVPSGTEADGVDVLEELPTIPSVPVCAFKGKGFYIHFPLEAGDEVLLVFLERDAAEWRRTGELSGPPDQRLHSLAHAVAIPALQSSGNALADADGTNFTLGSEGGIQITITDSELHVDGDTDAAALASATDQQLNDLKTAINGWTPVTNDGGGALKSALVSWISATAAVGSAVLKVGS